MRCAITVLTCGPVLRILVTGAYRTLYKLPATLLNSGGYSLKLLIVENENNVTYENDNITSFVVEDTAERYHAYMGREPGVVQLSLEWSLLQVV
jgi:hypothetical protein